MATVLSFNEQDRALLLLLTPEQRDKVFLSLLLGERQEMDSKAEIAWESISKSVERRAKDRKRKQEKASERYCNAEIPRKFHGSSTETPPLSPSSPPFLPPSPLPPVPPISPPPYNPPSPSSISPSRARKPSRTDAEFEAFWSAWPRKDGKQSARKAFDKVPSSISVELLVSAIRRQECSDQWRQNSGRYIPLPATWLNQARWEDEGIKREEPKRNKADDDFLAFLAESGVEV